MMVTQIGARPRVILTRDGGVLIELDREYRGLIVALKHQIGRDDRSYDGRRCRWTIVPASGEHAIHIVRAFLPDIMIEIGGAL